MAPHFAVGQEDPPFSADIHETALPGHGQDLHIAQLPFPHLGELHAGGHPSFGIQVQVDLHFVPCLHRTGLLVLVEQDVVGSIAGARVQESAHFPYPGHGHLTNISHPVPAHGLNGHRSMFFPHASVSV